MRCSMNNPRLFFFFPLASVGGAERVHADVMSALSAYPKEIFIRYRVNPWNGRAYAQSQFGKAESILLKREFESYGKLTFLSNYLEAPRLGRIIRAWYTKRLARRINACSSPIVIFWHRESIDFLWKHLASHVHIIDIVHNNSNNDVPDKTYLVNDWAARINHRVLVNAGLMKWITPMYQEQNDPMELLQKISVINHQVSFPLKLPSKSKEVFNVLFVGRDVKEKRLPLFFQIADHFLHEPQIRFQAVGVENSLNTPQNVHCHGLITDKTTIERLYAISHVLVLTSESEGFPKVISEAMAFGCVPVVTAVGAIPDVLEREESALLTNPQNCVEETIEHLARLCADGGELNRRSKKAYFYAKDHFDLERFNAEWRALIQSVG